MLLPRVLDLLSIARGQMLVDQLSTMVRSNGLDNVVLLVAEQGALAMSDADAEPVKLPVGFCVRALVILQIGHSNGRKHAATTATVLFAGPIDSDFFQRADPSQAEFITDLLAEKIDETLSRRGIRFIQWAQDILPPGVSPQSVSYRVDSDGKNVSPNVATAPDRWSEYLGFRPLAELIYLRRELTPHRNVSKSGATSEVDSESWRQSGPLRLVTMTAGTAQLQACESLVERTYADTLDCPELADMQSTEAILDGYRASPAFTSDLWFEARLAASTLPSELELDPVAGCLILGKHQSKATQADPLDDFQVGGVLELVYMGIVPEYRGRGLGARLVELTETIARREQCASVILAVDTRNRPARAAYEAAGFVPILSEQVWGKKICGQEIEASKNDST